MPEATPTDKLITVLSPSQALEPAFDPVYKAAQKILSTCTSEEPATKFDLQTEFTPILEEARRLYQKEKSLAQLPEISSHGALVLQKSVYVGRQFDTVMVPIAKEDNARVVARDASGKRVEIDWIWYNFIFASQLTYFDVETGKKVGAITVHFPREEKGQ